MDKKNIIFGTDINESLSSIIQEKGYDRIFILTDENTRKCCLPRINTKGSHIIEIPAGDEHKNLESLGKVWSALSHEGATRHSLLINLGGGMVTDLGGFAAATFKRGIAFINIPTTLLAMVDASTGGKTGINFEGLKNEVGTFAESKAVIIDTTFLQTLNYENYASGFAEIIKHALIDNEAMWHDAMNVDLFKTNGAELQSLIQKSVQIKQHIVSIDPKEKGLRKALNFGHTVGHAFESLSMMEHQPVLHGYAVAWGLICELYMSCKRLNFPHDILLQTIQFVKENYGVFTFKCNQYDTLFELMSHDKKNKGNDINFTLLSNIGEIHIDQIAKKDEIAEMFDFYRETMGC